MWTGANARPHCPRVFPNHACALHQTSDCENGWRWAGFWDTSRTRDTCLFHIYIYVYIYIYNPPTRVGVTSILILCRVQNMYQNPKSEIQNPKSEIQNPKSEIQNPKSEIQNPKSAQKELLHNAPKSKIRNPKSEIRNPKLGHRGPHKRIAT